MASIRLSQAAQDDIAAILDTTTEMFGAEARQRYEKLLVVALRDIASDPRRIGVKHRPECGEGVWSYHLRHSRDRARHDGYVVRSPRHLILFKEIEPKLLGVGRVLYDAMELERHLPDDYASL